MKTGENSENIIWKAEVGLAACCAILAITIFIYVFRAFGSSFDFTDESYYLVSIAEYRSFGFSVTQFGFIYHWIYVLVGRDIFLLRVANVAITLGLAFWLSFLVLKPRSPDVQQGWKARFCRVALALALASPSLSILNEWVPTPNYNGLALQALMVTAIGTLMAEETLDTKSTIGWVLIGLGGWLAFMAKPTTAMMLALLALLYLALSGKLRVRQLALALAVTCVMLLLTMLALDGSPPAFIERLIVGFQDGVALDGGHTVSGIVRWDPWVLMDKHLGVFLGVTLVVLCLTLFCLRDARLALAGMVLTLLTALAFLIWLPENIATFGSPDARSLGTVAVGLFLAGLIAAAIAVFGRTHQRIPLDRGLLAAVFVLLPFALAFGSINNYWYMGLFALLFWILGAVVLIRAVSPLQAAIRSVIPVILAGQCLIILLVCIWMDQPYRQPLPIRLQTAEVEIGSNGSSLKVADDFARYIRELRAIATESGFEPGDPMLDLTGRFPGALYAIGASSVGDAWMIGGYRGSEAFALRVLGRTSCETLARAWILTEEDGPTALPFSVTGARPADYDTAGTLRSPAERGESHGQVMLRPNNRAEMRARCERSRLAAL